MNYYQKLKNRFAPHAFLVVGLIAFLAWLAPVLFPRYFLKMFTETQTILAILGPALIAAFMVVDSIRKLVESVDGITNAVADKVQDSTSRLTLEESEKQAVTYLTHNESSEISIDFLGANLARVQESIKRLIQDKQFTKFTIRLLCINSGGELQHLPEKFRDDAVSVPIVVRNLNNLFSEPAFSRKAICVEIRGYVDKPAIGGFKFSAPDSQSIWFVAPLGYHSGYQGFCWLDQYYRCTQDGSGTMQNQMASHFDGHFDVYWQQGKENILLQINR